MGKWNEYTVTDTAKDTDTFLMYDGEIGTMKQIAKEDLFSGTDAGINITKAEYDALPEEEKNSGLYFISDIDTTGLNGIELTQAQYDALPTEEKNTGTYFIIDSGISPNRIEVVKKTYTNVAVTSRSASGAYYSGNFAIPELTSGTIPLVASVENWNGAASIFMVSINAENQLFFTSDVSQTISSAMINIVCLKQ